MPLAWPYKQKEKRESRNVTPKSLLSSEYSTSSIVCPYSVTAATQQPCAAAYQLWRQPCGCSVSASAALWLQWISSSTRRETKRALGEMENSGLLRWQSPESEPRRRVSQGFYGLLLPGPCLASWTRVTSGKVVDAETNLQKQVHGGGVVGAVG